MLHKDSTAILVSFIFIGINLHESLFQEYVYISWQCSNQWRILSCFIHALPLTIDYMDQHNNEMAKIWCSMNNEEKQFLIYSVIHSQNKDIDSNLMNRDAEDLTFLWVARLLQSYSHSSPSVQPASEMIKDFITSFFLSNPDTQNHMTIFLISQFCETKEYLFSYCNQNCIMTPLPNPPTPQNQIK